VVLPGGLTLVFVELLSDFLTFELVAVLPPVLVLLPVEV
jgi:hypothetical protein